MITPPNGRRRKNIPDLLNPHALNILPEIPYWQLVQLCLDDMVTPTVPGRFTDHEQAFGRFAMLAMSPLGNCCWPKADLWLSRMTVGDIEHILHIKNGHSPFLIEIRQTMPYPIFISEDVELALLLNITACMRNDKNKALRSIHPEFPLAPNPNAARELIEKYFIAATNAVGLSTEVTLPDYLATGRWLMTRLYQLDVIYATLGAIDATAPPINQLLRHGANNLMDALEQPVGGHNE